MTCLQSLMSIYLLANDLQKIHTKLRHILFWNLIFTGNILDEPVCLCGLLRRNTPLTFLCKKYSLYFDVWMFIGGLRDQDSQNSISFNTWMGDIQISMLIGSSI